MRDQYAPSNRLTPQVTTAAEVANAPAIWAIPGLLPCHHLSAILAPTGTGLTHLAIQICAHLAPAQPVTPSATTAAPDQAPSSPVADLSSKSVLDPDISYLQPQIPNPPLPPSPSLALTPSVVPPSPHLALSPSSDPPIPAVLFVGGREHAETLRARLAAAGADLRRILFLTGVTDGAWGDEIRRPVCADNYNIISDLLHQHKGIRLVIIDNAEDLFCDSNRIKRNRLLRQLACFRMVAEKHEANICLLANVPQLDAHPCRTTFLSCTREVCRAVHLLTPDLPAPQSHPQPPLSDLQSQISDCSLTSSSHRLLITIKNTLASTCPTLRLNVFEPFNAATQSQIENRKSKIADLTYPRYLSLRDSTGARGPKPVKLDYACQVLVELLRGGPLPVGDIKRPAKGTIVKLTGEASIAWNTVQRAMASLNIQAKRIGKRWHWQLPDTIPHAESAPAQLAQQTSLSCPQDSTQPQPSQEDTQGRATPEKASSSSPSTPANEQQTATNIPCREALPSRRRYESDAPPDSAGAMDSVAAQIFVWPEREPQMPSRLSRFPSPPPCRILAGLCPSGVPPG